MIDDARQAFGSLLADARPEDVLLVAGSLYLLGEVRPVVQGANADCTRSKLAVIAAGCSGAIGIPRA